MADKTMPWFRLYTEFIFDRKVAVIMRMTKRSKIEIIGALTVIFALGSDSPVRGQLLVTQDMPYSIDDIANVLEMTIQDTEALMMAAEKMEILIQENGIWIIRNWNKRQYKSDDSSERVTRFRDNQHKPVTTPLHGRYSNVSVTPPETESESETESETESEYKQADDKFSAMQALVECKTGYLINQADIPAINRFIESGVIEEDIDEAVAFFVDKGKVAMGAANLEKSVMFALGKRIQKNGKKPKPAQVWTEEH